jgi:transposase InsO family protein
MERLKQLGYTVKDGCSALGISRSGYYALKLPKKEAQKTFRIESLELLEKIKAIKSDHPFWGYRRVRAWLVHREKIQVNEKRIRRIMKEHGLMATQTVHKVNRRPQRNKPKADKPRQYWGIDMTKFMIPVIGWAYLVIVLDWYTKKIVGWDLSLRSKAADWKRAVEIAINSEFPEGVRGNGLKLISDNGSQPTATSFMKDMAVLGIEQVFTSYDNPKGNADTERMIRTIKEEIIWLNEFSSFEEAKEKIGKGIEIDYNQFYVHSELGYMSPEEFEKLYDSRIYLGKRSLTEDTQDRGWSEKIDCRASNEAVSKCTIALHL